MRIGALNIPFLVKAQSLVSDGEGGHIAQWTTLASLCGSLAPLDPDGLVESDDKATHMIVARCRNDIAIGCAHRLTYENRIFQIRKVVIDERRKSFVQYYVSEISAFN